MRRLLTVRWSLRRQLVIQTVRLKALLQRARVEMVIAPDVKFGARTQITVFPGTASRIEIGPGCHLQEGVFISLRGGSLRMGPGASIRRGSVLNLAGNLELGARTIISYYNVIHCADRIQVDEMVVAAEFVTMVDSRHFHDGEHEFFYENVEAAPIRVGRNVWIANKATILMGVTIGDDATVAAHAVVTDDVPAKAVVAGIPARVIRQR